MAKSGGAGADEPEACAERVERGVHLATMLAEAVRSHYVRGYSTGQIARKARITPDLVIGALCLSQFPEVAYDYAEQEE